MLHRIHVAQLFLSASRFLPDKGSYAEDILFRRTNEKFSFLSSVRFELFFPERWQPHLFLFYRCVHMSSALVEFHIAEASTAFMQQQTRAIGLTMDCP